MVADVSRAGKRWTPEEVSQAQEMYVQGVSADDMAAHFKRSRGSIIDLLCKKKISNGKRYLNKKRSEQPVPPTKPIVAKVPEDLIAKAYGDRRYQDIKFKVRA